MTEKTWNYILKKRLGIRVAKTTKDIKGAAFGLDDGIALGEPPKDWIFKLKETIKWQLGFAKTHDRHHLLIVEDCPTSVKDREYGKKYFPKCHRVPEGSKVVATTPLQGKDAFDLWIWVETMILQE